MVVYKNYLYVSGFFSKSNGNVGNNIQKWDGSSWSEVGGGVPGPIHNGSKIFKMLVFQDKLYVVGNFTMAGNIHSEFIAVWDGVKWCSLGNSMDNTILSLCSYNDSLYIGGGFQVIDGDSLNHVAKWIGGSFTDSCQQINGIFELSSTVLEIFPNPSSNIFNFKINDQQYQYNYVIKNLLGKIFEEGRTSIQTDENISFDLTNYESGIYIIQLETSKHIYLGKVLKQ